MNSIPNKILNEFVESKVGYKDLGKVTDIRQHFLWGRNNLDVYRINVWIEYCNERDNITAKKISHSFFVHFLKEEKILTDKTSGYS
jgi:hypothetical protein